jgi:hypothetical protein
LLLIWIDSFPKITSTVHRSPVPLNHFGEFLVGANKEDCWLFAIACDSTLAIEIFTAITQNIFGLKFNYRWLALEKYVSRRFINRCVSLDVDTLRRLFEAGDGDISTSLAKNLNCRSMDSIYPI